MLNKVVLIGRLTKDPDLRYTTSGVPVTRFILAVNRSYTNQQGEREADFIPITVWRNAAENCAKYLQKGRLVAVAGRIQTGSYTATDGSKRYTTDVVADEVQFLEWGNKQEQRQDDIPGFELYESNEPLPF
ncbi:MAG TPA: single-stranded DNA-binding protein [Clostridiales bacterium]|nr:single-stranded DNA-binding protein [Clostridiales bacterium]